MKEAMKLALEALEAERDNYQDWDEKDGAPEYIYEAITDLRVALADQPAQQEPVAWKLVPVEPTEEMLKAMDECSKEGYDERLYAGHAASVYMAAVDSAPTPPAQRKPLTDEQIEQCMKQAYATVQGRNLEHAFARAIEAAHGIKGEA